MAVCKNPDEGWLDFSALRLQTAGELPMAETGRLLLVADSDLANWVSFLS